jgi:hypothetical protein
VPQVSLVVSGVALGIFGNNQIAQVSLVVSGVALGIFGNNQIAQVSLVWPWVSVKNKTSLGHSGVLGRILWCF